MKTYKYTYIYSSVYNANKKISMVIAETGSQRNTILVFEDERLWVWFFFNFLK